MGLKQLFTKIIFGEQDIIEDGVVIVDGEVILSPEMIEEVHGRIDKEEANITVNAPTMEQEGQMEPEEPPSERGDYEVFLRMSGKAERTIKEYLYDLKIFSNRFKLDTLSKAQIESVLSELKPPTATRKLSALRCYAKWLASQSNTDLLGQVYQVKINSKPRASSPVIGSSFFRDIVDLAKSLCISGDRRGLWIGLMACCGLKITEIQCIDYVGRSSIKISSNGLTREVPAPNWLIESLVDIPQEKWKVSREYIWRILNSLGIAKPSDYRHAYASQLIKNDYSIEEVARTLGHKNLASTRRYDKNKVPRDISKKLNME